MLARQKTMKSSDVSMDSFNPEKRRLALVDEVENEGEARGVW